MTIRGGQPELLRGIIFDLFGTLIVPDRFEETNIAHLLEWAAVRGLPVSPDATQVVEEASTWMWQETRLTGRQVLRREALARAADQLGWRADEALLTEATRVFFTPEVGTVRAYPDAVTSLEALGQMGLRLGLISIASDHGLVEQVLHRTGLAPYLDPVVSSAAFGRVKPDPGIFRFVLERWGSPPEQCVMVGDTLDADIEGAQALGMRAILVTMDPNPNNARVADRIRPDATAATLEQAVQIIRTWTGHPEPGA